jgi:hypothetical protein
MRLFTMQLQSTWCQFPEGRNVGGFKRRKASTAPLHCAELVLGDERGAGGEPMFVATNGPALIE